MKCVVAIIMTVAMLVGMFPAASIAVDASNELVTVSTGNLNPSDNTDDENVKLSKTAQVGETPGTWNVTLKAEINQAVEPVPLEVVLLIDRSNSMSYKLDKDVAAAGDEKSRLQIVKDVLLEEDGLIETLQQVDAKISIITYCGNVYTGLSQNTKDIYDLSTEEGYQAARSRINGIQVGAYTDLKAGLESTNEVIEEKMSANSKRAVIVLGDGACLVEGINGSSDYIDPDNLHNDAETEYINGLKEASAKARSLADVYGVFIGPTEEGSGKIGLATLDKIVLDSNSQNLYTAQETNKLKQNFEDIALNILTMISDPMSEWVTCTAVTSTEVNGETVGDADEYPKATVSSSGSTVSWRPDKGLESGDTITIKYTVKLKDDQENLKKDL